MVAPSPSKSMFEIIKERTGDLSLSEKKVARTILADYPAAGLQTVAELAKDSNVSGQTVIRFVGRLGFESFPAFHAQLLEELKVRNAPPTVRHEEQKSQLDQDNILGQCHTELSKNLTETFSRLPEGEFDAAVEILCDTKREILATGGRSSTLLAEYLILQLQQMRPKTKLIPNEKVARAHTLVDVNSRTTFVLFDFRRYSEGTLKFAEQAQKKGAQILLITDPYLSPISKYAHTVLPVQVEFITPFDSQLGALATIEALVAASTKNLSGLSNRMAKYETYRKALS